MEEREREMREGGRERECLKCFMFLFLLEMRV